MTDRMRVGAKGPSDGGMQIQQLVDQRVEQALAQHGLGQEDSGGPSPFDQDWMARLGKAGQTPGAGESGGDPAELVKKLQKIGEKLQSGEKLEQEDYQTLMQAQELVDQQQGGPELAQALDQVEAAMGAAEGQAGEERAAA